MHGNCRSHINGTSNGCDSAGGCLDRWRLVDILILINIDICVAVFIAVTIAVAVVIAISIGISITSSVGIRIGNGIATSILSLRSRKRDGSETRHDSEVETHLERWINRLQRSKVCWRVKVRTREVSK